jgi:IS30 family transposase
LSSIFPGYGIFLEIFIKKYDIITDMESMEVEGLSAAELGKRLGRLPDTVKKQLKSAGEKPIGYIGPVAIYEYSAEEKIRIPPHRGRPSKSKSQEPEDK